MAASINDKFNQATTTTRPEPAVLTAVKASGASTLTVDSTTGWPTDTAVHFILYQVDADGARVEGTQIDMKGIVNSSTTINNLTLKAGTDAEYPIGSKVICAPTAAWADDVVEGIAVHANQDGTLKDDAVATSVIADSAVTTAKIADNAVTDEKREATVAFRAYAGSVVAIPIASPGKITLDTENYDLGADFDATTNYRFTAPYAGVYHFDGAVGFSSGNERTFVSLYKNGSEIARGTDIETSAGIGRSTTVSTDLQLAANDYIELYAFADDGFDSIAGSVFTYMSGHLVGRTD